MPESVLSARRSPPSQEEDDGDDESKTRKHASLAARISMHGRLDSASHCLAVSLSLLLLLLVASFLVSRSRPVICGPAYDSIARTTLFESGLERLASDFGSLGVPWCKSFKSACSFSRSQEIKVV